MRARYLLLVAVVVAGLFSAMAIRSAQGEVRSVQGQAGRTLTFRAPPPPPRDHHHVDVPPHGLSLGDRDVGAVSLRRNGELFGRAMAVCTINDASFRGQQCAFTLVLRKGQITVQGGGLDRNLPHAPPPSDADVFAVTGGTGIYAGANGTLTIRHGRHADFFTVALR
jgi:hypothetical protein